MSAPDVRLRKGDVIHLQFPSCNDAEEREKVNQELLGYYGEFGVLVGAISWVPGMVQIGIISVCRND